MQRDHTIPFIQYILPYGRRKETEAPCTKEIYDLGQQFISAGGSYECEILTTGMVSLTAVYPINNEPQDIAIELSSNDESIHVALEKLVNSSVKYLANTLTKPQTP